MSDIWTAKFLEFLRLRTPVPLSQWADAHRVLASGASPEAGRWRTARTPYLRQIMDAVTDPGIHEVVVCSGVQLGKTELLLNAMCYYIEHEPSPIMLVEPSEDLVVQLGRERIDTMIKASPALRPLFGFTEDLKVKTGVLSGSIKRFAGGYIKLSSAASPTDLISRPIRIVLCDEVDRYPARSDGNAIDMAIGRTTNFINRKILITSSPGSLQASEVWRRFGACAQYEYRIPCPHCGEASVWCWPMVKWDKREDGTGDTSTARMECPHCGGVVRDSGPASSVQLATGSWVLVSGDPACGNVGFRVTGLMSPWMPLSGIVAEWIAANQARDVDRLRTFIQDRLAEPWEDRMPTWRGQSANAGSRFERRPDHSTIRFLTAGVDVQRDRVEVSVWGFGASMESWAVSHTVIIGDPLSMDLWAQLREFLATPVAMQDGREGRIFAACVDSGDGHTTQAVYQFCAPLERNRVVAIKGVGGDNVPLISPPSRIPQYHSPLYKLGVDRFKQVFYDRLNIAVVGPGYIHITEDLSGEFWAQLTAESPETHVERGRQVTRWVQHRARNEALDCAVYALAAYEMFCHAIPKQRRIIRR